MITFTKRENLEQPWYKDVKVAFVCCDRDTYAGGGIIDKTHIINNKRKRVTYWRHKCKVCNQVYWFPRKYPFYIYTSQMEHYKSILEGEMKENDNTK